MWELTGISCNSSQGFSSFLHRPRRPPRRLPAPRRRTTATCTYVLVKRVQISVIKMLEDPTPGEPCIVPSGCSTSPEPGRFFQLKHIERYDGPWVTGGRSYTVS